MVITREKINVRIHKSLTFAVALPLCWNKSNTRNTRYGDFFPHSIFRGILVRIFMTTLN